MLLDPAPIALSNHGAARKPEIGVDKCVYVSKEPCRTVATLNQAGTDTMPTATLDVDSTQVLDPLGECLSIRSKNALLSDGTAPVEIQLDVIFDDGTAGTATSTFAPPAWVDPLDYCGPIGICKDLVDDSGAERKITDIVGLVAVLNGDPLNCFEICTNPSEDSWFQIDCAQTANGPYDLPQGIDIPCRRETAAYTVTGRSDTAPELTLSDFYKGGWDNLARFNGHYVTVRVDTLKGGNLLTDRAIFCDYLVNASPSRTADDNEVVEEESTSTYSKFCLHTAL